MTKQTQKYGQKFGIAAISVVALDSSGNPGDPVGYSELPGSLELTGLSQEVVTTTGGFHTYPVHARSGTGSGEAKLMLNEAPTWLTRIALGGSFTSGSTETASTTAQILPKAADSNTADTGLTYPVSPDTGNTTGQLGLMMQTGATNVAAGRYWIEVDATDARLVDVTAHTARGEFKFNDIDPEDATVANRTLGDLGLVLTVPGGTIANTLVSGHSGYIDVLPPHNGRSGIRVDGNPQHGEYQLKAWTVARRGKGDNLVEITLPRIQFHGYVPKSEYNVAVDGLEFSIQMLEPLASDSSGNPLPIFTTEHINDPR